MMEIDGVGPMPGTTLARPSGVPGGEFTRSLDAALRAALPAVTGAAETVAAAPVTAVPIAIPSAETGLALEIMTEIRSGLLDSYREIQRMLA